MTPEKVYEQYSNKGETLKKNMGDDGEDLNHIMSFYEATTFITHFDGDADYLNLFCSGVRLVNRTYGPKYEKFLLLQIANRLTGKAAEAFVPLIARYDSVEKLLGDLGLHYANIGATDEIYKEMLTINQGLTESAIDFGLRIQKLYHRLRTIFEFTPNFSEIEREFRTRQADKDALKQFLFALREPLNNFVTSKQPKTLSTAIREAAIFENKINSE